MRDLIQQEVEGGSLLGEYQQTRCGLPIRRRRNTVQVPEARLPLNAVFGVEVGTIFGLQLIVAIMNELYWSLWRKEVLTEICCFIALFVVAMFPTQLLRIVWLPLATALFGMVNAWSALRQARALLGREVDLDDRGIARLRTIHSLGRLAVILIGSYLAYRAHN